MFIHLELSNDPSRSFYNSRKRFQPLVRHRNEGKVWKNINTDIFIHLELSNDPTRSFYHSTGGVSSSWPIHISNDRKSPVKINTTNTFVHRQPSNDHARPFYHRTEGISSSWPIHISNDRETPGDITRVLAKILQGQADREQRNARGRNASTIRLQRRRQFQGFYHPRGGGRVGGGPPLSRACLPVTPTRIVRRKRADVSRSGRLVGKSYERRP